MRKLPVILALAAAPGCVSAPIVQAPAVTFEQKMGWILRLEDQRILRDPAVAPVEAPVARRGRALATPAPPPADLVALLSDAEGRVRRRAALAIGRVRLAEGIAPLSALLDDADPEVRSMAAFALGLVGDKAAAPALIGALNDPSPVVRGRAAEALGLVGDAAAAPAIAEMAAGAAASLGPIASDDVASAGDPAREAFRLGVYALARLKAYAPLAAAVLDASGRPRTEWWPSAYALRQVADPRGAPALTELLRSRGSFTAAFAARGLGALKNASAVVPLVAALNAPNVDPRVAVSAVRALGEIGDARASPALVGIASRQVGDPLLRLEAVVALGTVKAAGATELLQDLVSDPWPAMRAAALRSLAMVDPEIFLLVVSGLDPDPHWTVNAALAAALGTFDAEIAATRLTDLLSGADLRARPAVMEALVKVRAANAESVLRAELQNADLVVRAAAARLLGELKPEGGAAALIAAYRFGAADASYLARAAALAALTKYGAAAATDTVKGALGDKDWALRVRAVELLAELDPTGEHAAAIRPAPAAPPRDGGYEAPRLVDPRVSPHAYVDTDQGTIQIELAVLDAPLTVENFVALAGRGFFNGVAIHRVVPNFVVQDGDPRGDGEGGPGYTIRDELNMLPYLRGTVGMALDWRDTGGSQFFITHSPQPHLDARYTVFGHVVAGMDVVDKLKQGDVIKQIRIWEGEKR